MDKTLEAAMAELDRIVAARKKDLDKIAILEASVYEWSTKSNYFSDQLRKAKQRETRRVVEHNHTKQQLRRLQASLKYSPLTFRAPAAGYQYGQ